MRAAFLFFMSVGMPLFAPSGDRGVMPQASQDLLFLHAAIFQRLEVSFADTTTIFVESNKCVDSKARVGCVVGLVNAPIDRVWKIITDYRKYTQWIPRCTRSVVVSPKIIPSLSDSSGFPLSMDISQCTVERSIPSETTLVYSEIDIIFPVGRIRSILEITSDSTDFTICWRKLASDMTIYEGAWHVISSGDQTLVVCMMRYQLNVWLPPFMIHGAIRYYLPQMITTLRQRVHEEP